MNKTEKKQYINTLKNYGYSLEKKYIEIDKVKVPINTWIGKTMDFHFDNKENPYHYNSSYNIPNLLLYYLFKITAQKYTKKGLFWPCVLFFLISLISLTSGALLEYSPNNGFWSFFPFQRYLLLFLGGFMLVMGVILGLKYFVFKEKIIYKQKKGYFRYQHINYKKYQEITSKLFKSIEKNEDKLLYIMMDKYKIVDFEESDYLELYNLLKSDDIPKIMKVTGDLNKKMICDNIIRIKKEYKIKQNCQFLIKEQSNNSIAGRIEIMKEKLTPKTACFNIVTIKDNIKKEDINQIITAITNYLISINKNSIFIRVNDNQKDVKEESIKLGFEEFEDSLYLKIKEENKDEQKDI